MSNEVVNRVLAGLALLAVAAWPVPGEPDSARVTPERPAEYMVYQYPETVLVIRVDVPEAEFGARVLGPERTLIKSSGVRERRLGPVYHYIDAADLPRQLMIEVTPARPVDRSAIGLEIIQFTAGDRNAATLARAFRLFSIGTETAHSDDTATWATKIYSLRNAADHFAALGREEMRLWSEYFGAHLVLHELEDRLMAVELSREIQQAADRAGFEEVGLAADALEGDALLQILEVGNAKAAPVRAADAGDFQRAHEVLLEVADRAGALGLSSEQARALYNDGRVFERQGQTRNALERYERALDVMAGTQDLDLLNDVRATAASAYEVLGSTGGALELLDEIAGDLDAEAEDSAARELADRLFEKGRLLNYTYRYGEAVAELRRALELQQADAAAAAWGVTGLELAWAYYALGRDDEAIDLVQASLPRTPLEGNAALLARAYGSLANMYRARGSFQQAAQARETQGNMLGAGDGGADGQAEFLLETAADARQRHGAASRETRELLRWSSQAAMAEGDDLTAARAALHLCLADLERDTATRCRDRAEEAYLRLRQAGVPRYAIEAAVVHARVLERSGDAGGARGLLAAALDEAEWYQRVLPGVLGASYAGHAADLARDYLRLAGTGDPGGAAARQLLALDRVRRFEAAETERPSLLQSDRDEALRSLLARREAAVGAEGERLAIEVNREIERVRQSCAGCAGPDHQELDEAELRRLLGELDRSEAVLAYYLGEEDSWAVLAGRAGPRRYDLAGADRIRDALSGLRELLAGGGLAAALPELDSLGRLLLAPLPGDWPARVYLLPAGPLRAVPFDALRVEGRHIGRDVGVVNVASLDSLRRRSPALRQGFSDRVFVAGNPQSQRDPFRFDLSTSPEIRAVTDRFVGPGLLVVQGVALGRDEFADARFSGAALLHLAMPGVVDLTATERSRLLLSAGAETSQPPGDSVLSPADIRDFRLDADLVMLTATTLANSGDLPYAGRLPLVSDFLAAGAATVSYAQWPAGEAASAAFAEAFYSRLETDPDIVGAFVETKMAAFGPAEQTNLRHWAGFQLFIR